MVLGVELGQDFFVELGRGDDGHALEVLGRGPEHSGPAHVYLLYGLLLGGVARHGLLERVEVYADEVYGTDVVVDELYDVVGVFEIGEDAAVDLGVQRLDPPAEDLRRPSHLGDRDDGDAGLRERLRGASGRDDLEPHVVQAPRERSHPPLVRDRHQGPPLHSPNLPKK